MTKAPDRIELDDCRDGTVAVTDTAGLDHGFYVIQAGGQAPPYARGPFLLGAELTADIDLANDGGNNPVELLVVTGIGASIIPPEMIAQAALVSSDDVG